MQKIGKNKLEKTYEDNLKSLNLNESQETDIAVNNILNNKTSLSNSEFKQLANDIIDISYTDKLNKLMKNILSLDNIVFNDNISKVLKYYNIYNWQFCVRRLNQYDEDFIDIVINK